MKLHRSRPFMLVLAFFALCIGFAGLSAPVAAQAGWEPYLKLLTQDVSNVRSAAIYGQDGAKWAANFEAQSGEIAALVAGLADPTKFQSGVYFGAVKHFYLGPRNPDGIMGRKGPSTILIRPTRKAIVIVITQDLVNPDKVKTIDLVAEELISKGF